MFKNRIKAREKICTLTITRNYSSRIRPLKPTLNAKALFLIFSNDDLFGKVTHLYDFNEHSIKPESLENGDVDLSSSSRKLVKVAYNLYNGHYEADVLDTFAGLDDQNANLDIQAIKIRFNLD